MSCLPPEVGSFSVILDMHTEEGLMHSFLGGMCDLYNKTYTDRHQPNPKYL